MPCILLLVPPFLHPLLNVLLLLPHRSPCHQTGNCHWHHLPHLPSLACTTRLHVNQCHTCQLNTLCLWPLFGSTHRWTCRSLDLDLLDLFLYIFLSFFILDLFPLLLAPLLLDKLLSSTLHCCCALTYHSFLLVSLFTRHLFLYDAVQLVAGRTPLSVSPFCHSFVSLCSTYCLVILDSIYIPKPSPGESQATVACFFPPLSLCILGNCGPSFYLS